jgi:hypothetical protein
MLQEEAFRKRAVDNTNVCPSVILEGEDYGLKVSITSELSRRNMDIVFLITRYRLSAK